MEYLIILGQKLIIYFFLNFKYHEIKRIDKNKLNVHGYFFDFIYWLISDIDPILEKMNKLKEILKKMGKEYFEYFFNKLIDNIKNNKN